MSQKFREILSKCKIDSLNQLALISGIPIGGTNKQGRIESLINGLNIQKRLPERNISILSIDIGIKNFSYCQMNDVNVQSDTANIVNNWTKIDLNQIYGSSYVPIVSSSSMIDSKRYLNYCCQNLVKDITTAKKPDLVIMETQRTRSNNNAITIPNVLLNYTFENIFYSNLYNKYPDLLIVPMSSTSMIHFWFNRFVNKKSLKNLSTAKKSRANLFFHWLEMNKLFTIPGYKVDADLSIPKKSQSLLNHLDLIKGDKVDDLIDSLFYNLTIKAHVHNQKELYNLLQQEDADLNYYIIKHNITQLSLVLDIIQQFDMELAPEFSRYFDFFGPLINPQDIEYNKIQEFAKISKM
ncbi:cruciform cutting endonuclease [Scheffersomyces coipomensis]|uniref:cruciform cutting endonuclease n=1 Tax=Scheffersomyces coipomensis TaxID=1788519 RepID=UPI00315D5C4D